MSYRLGIGPRPSQCTIRDEDLRSISTPSQNATVILPEYKEVTSVCGMVLLPKLYVDKLIVDDNASTDLTVEITRKSSAETITYEINTGKETAQKTGFATAVKIGAELIVTMYSDGHHAPADLRVGQTVQNKANKMNYSILHFSANNMAKKPKCLQMLKVNCCGCFIAIARTLMHSMSAILGNTKLF